MSCYEHIHTCEPARVEKRTTQIWAGHIQYSIASEGSPHDLHFCQTKPVFVEACCQYTAHVKILQAARLDYQEATEIKLEKRNDQELLYQVTISEPKNDSEDAVITSSGGGEEA